MANKEKIMSNLPVRKLTKNMKKRLETKLDFSVEDLLEAKDIENFRGNTSIHGEFISNYNGYTNDFRKGITFLKNLNEKGKLFSLKKTGTQYQVTYFGTVTRLTSFEYVETFWSPLSEKYKQDKPKKIVVHQTTYIKALDHEPRPENYSSGSFAFGDGMDAI